MQSDLRHALHRVNKGEDTHSVHLAEELKEGVRNDRRPMSEVDLGPEGNQGVRLDHRANLCPGFVKVHIENAAVLHVGRQQA
jgi:hypothetical protein